MMAGRAATGCLEDEPAALRQEICAGLGFERSPDRVRPLHQRGIRLALADRLAGDAGVPVG